MATITITEARAKLPEVVARVEAGEEVTLTRHGRPVAVVVRPDSLRHRRVAEAMAAADALGERLAAAALRPIGGPGISLERAEEMVRELRRQRDTD